MTMDRRRLWFALFVTVVFALGVAVGLGLGRFMRFGPPFGRGGPPGPPPTPAMIVERMTQDLGLSAEQQSQLEGILGEGEQRMRLLQQSTRDQFDVERKRLDAEIERVLTPDQQTKFRRRPPPPRRPPDGRPPRE